MNPGGRNDSRRTWLIDVRRRNYSTLNTLFSQFLFKHFKDIGFFSLLPILKARWKVAVNFKSYVQAYLATFNRPSTKTIETLHIISTYCVRTLQPLTNNWSM